jgi:hypothetical protein
MLLLLPLPVASTLLLQVRRVNHFVVHCTTPCFSCAQHHALSACGHNTKRLGVQQAPQSAAAAAEYCRSCCLPLPPSNHCSCGCAMC